MAGDLSFEKRTKKGACLVLLCSSSVCITSLLDMAINLQLIMKNHPVIRIRISKAKIAKPNVRLIMIESKSPKQIFMSDHLGNILVCVITTHCFFLFVYFSAIMFIFFMWVELFMGLTFLHPDTIVKDFLFEIHMHIGDTY